MSKFEGKPITCKAAIVREFKKPLTFETIQVQPPGHGEVRVKIVASGLCHSDLFMMDGGFTYHPLPYVPGHEGAGVVESIGEGVKSVKPGDKVFTMFLPQCQQCPYCKDRLSNFCVDPGYKAPKPDNFIRTLGYDGNHKFFCNGKPLFHSLGSSCFSEYTVIPENSCVKLDPATHLETACIMACGFLTGYGASANSVKIKPGDITAVWGMGGVGLATVVGCKESGAGRIIGIDTNPEKEAVARKLGCTDFICANNPNKSVLTTLDEMTHQLGVHFAFSCIGNIKTMEDIIGAIRPGGTAVIVGVTPKEATIDFSPGAMLPGKKVVGSTYGDYMIHEDVTKLVKRYMDGKFPIKDFITGTYKLDGLNDAINVMRQGKSIRSVVLM